MALALALLALVTVIAVNLAAVAVPACTRRAGRGRRAGGGSSSPRLRRRHPQAPPAVRCRLRTCASSTRAEPCGFPAGGSAHAGDIRALSGPRPAGAHRRARRRARERRRPFHADRLRPRVRRHPRPSTPACSSWAQGWLRRRSARLPAGERERPRRPRRDRPRQPAGGHELRHLEHDSAASAALRSARRASIDPARIAVAGQSDGGDTALAVAYDPRTATARIAPRSSSPGGDPLDGRFSFRPARPCSRPRAPPTRSTRPDLTNSSSPRRTRPSPPGLERAEHLPSYTRRSRSWHRER